MSGDTRHPWSYPGCIGRDVNRGTWVDPLSSNRGSNVRNVIWNQGVGSNSHGDLLLLAGTVGEALFNRSAFGTPALRLGCRATYGCLPTKTMLQKGAGPKVPPDTKLLPPPPLPPVWQYRLHTTHPAFNTKNHTKNSATNVHVDRTHI